MVIPLVHRLEIKMVRITLYLVVSFVVGFTQRCPDRYHKSAVVFVAFWPFANKT